MKRYGKFFQMMSVMLLATALQPPPASAQWDADSLRNLGAEWWQWIVSIPPADNPLLDPTGEKCMVGQRGRTWFLAGTFGGGTAVRTCSVPEGTTLFFPVANAIGFDTPGVCGQGEPIPAAKYREDAAAFIDGVSNVSVHLDGKAARAHRITSPVFAVTPPEDNIFDVFCALPAGVYSPAVDDGLYVQLRPLSVGMHTLRFHAENSSQGFVLDVTYTLDVRRRSRK